MKFADLHVHTYYSDGTFSPAQAVAEAKRVGLSCISITDHDTVQGIDEAVLAAQGEVEILPGIEMTAESGGQEIHILGYLIDYKSEAFLAMLKRMQEVRTKRVYEICQKLNKLGVAIEPEKIFALASRGSVGRLHVARAMAMGGFVSSIDEAFQRYISDRGPAYVGKFKMTPKEAIQWIAKVNGVAVLAHPFTLGDRSLISDFVKAGIQGIEVFYAEHSEFQTQEFLKIAEKFGLLVTGGSDCHGLAKDEAKLGRVKLPYEYVEKLKAARCGQKK